MAFYIYWNVKPDSGRTFLIPSDFEELLPLEQSREAFGILDSDGNNQLTAWGALPGRHPDLQVRSRAWARATVRAQGCAGSQILLTSSQWASCGSHMSTGLNTCIVWPDLLQILSMF